MAMNPAILAAVIDEWNMLGAFETHSGFGRQIILQSPVGMGEVHAEPLTSECAPLRHSAPASHKGCRFR